MLNRREIIDQLVRNDMSMMDFADAVDNFLRYGFKGYYHMTDEELLDAAHEREIGVEVLS